MITILHEREQVLVCLDNEGVVMYKMFKPALVKRSCHDCIYLSEDWAGGSGELFCSCPDTDFYLETFDPTCADDCEFFYPLYEQS